MAGLQFGQEPEPGTALTAELSRLRSKPLGFCPWIHVGGEKTEPIIAPFHGHGGYHGYCGSQSPEGRIASDP